VIAACDFLAGQTGEMESELKEQMEKSAAEEDFEKAAQFRDALQDLRRTTQKTRHYKRMPCNLPVAIEPRLDLAELAEVLHLPAAPARIEGFDISNISGTFAVASMVSFRDGKPDRSNYRRFRIKTVTGQDDFACMAETVRRRYSRLLRERAEIAEGRAPSPLPDLIVVDGGRGQLNATVAELAQLGLGRVAVIGLAKEFEEIFQPGRDEPLRLSHDSGALKLLQRVRDESHRFANTYNAQLRLRKISESILDEFPGIGRQRKAALLKKFGSVQRLRFATVEAIAAVPGFGGKAAAELKKFLEARSSAPNPTKV
jgi:excinuclease ABC subunit C